MFPFRKLMFLILAIASFIYSYTVYSMQLFTEGNAHIGWLVLSVMTSSLLLLFVLRIFPFRSEEHTSELQSRDHLVCRLLLEKKKKHTIDSTIFLNMTKVNICISI